MNGTDFENVAFSVSPSDIVREMFLPEDWVKIKKRSVQLIAYNASENKVTLELRQRWRLHRTLELQQVNPENPRWVIIRHLRYDAAGHDLAITELSKYNEIDGVLFPEDVDAYFPTEETRMTFKLKDIRLNSDVSESTFDIEARARELQLLDATVDLK